MVQQQMVKQKWMQGFDVVFGEDMKLSKRRISQLLDSTQLKTAEGEFYRQYREDFR